MVANNQNWFPWQWLLPPQDNGHKEEFAWGLDQSC